MIQTRYVWGPNVEAAMNAAKHMERCGWSIEGNPAPMTYRGQYGTGVAISRENDL